MPPTPEGPYTVPLHKLAQMVAECAAFQTRVGLTYPDADAEAKLVNGDGGFKRIFYPAIEDENDPLLKLPSAIISYSEDWSMQMIAGGDRNYFHGARGSLEFGLMDHDRHPHSIEASMRDFMNFIGMVIQSGNTDTPGLCELSAKDDRLIISEISQMDPPEICSRDVQHQKQRAYWSARFQIRYGLSQ